jgi:ketosteroid isomerase-like protein
MTGDLRTLAGMAFAAALMAQPTRAQQLDEAALATWLSGYEAAWEQRDAAAAAQLFTADADYHETAYADPFRGRDGIRAYWASVTADQQDIDFESSIVAINGNTGVARWSARLTNASSGAPVELDGVFVLVFDAGGLCSELREWWFVRSEAP